MFRRGDFVRLIEALPRPSEKLQVIEDSCELDHLIRRCRGEEAFRIKVGTVGRVLAVRVDKYTRECDALVKFQGRGGVVGLSTRFLEKTGIPEDTRGLTTPGLPYIHTTM